ncbi:MAG: hypothetical protein ACUZ8I_10460 [Candidatus Scalindua sp.]
MELNNNNQHKTGRPYKGLDVMLGVTVTKEMKENVLKRAKSLDKSLSSYIRELVRKDLLI